MLPFLGEAWQRLKFCLLKLSMVVFTGAEKISSVKHENVHPLCSFSVEERRSFAERINEVLADSPQLKGSLPMDPNSNALFDVRKFSVLMLPLIT